MIDINNFLANLIEYTGVAGEFLLNGEMFENKQASTKASKDDNHSAFFRPVKSVPDFTWRSLYVVTAPIVFALGAVTCAFICLGTLIASIIETACDNPQEAKDDLMFSGTFLLYAIASVILALVSPVINAIDLVGGCVKSFSNLDETQTGDNDHVYR